MNEAILLNSLLSFLYGENGEDSSIKDVSYNADGSLRILCSSSKNVVYRTSILLLDGSSILGTDKSSIIPCFKTYRSYLKKLGKPMLVVKEGVDIDSGKLVYIKLKATNCNVDVLLMELTRELDRYLEVLGVSMKSINSFVYDTYDKNINIYPLKSDIEGECEELKLSVKKDNIDCSGLYDKVPRLKGRFDEGLLKCMGYFLGDFNISVDIIREGEIYVPVMYFLSLENIINSIGLC